MFLSQPCSVNLKRIKCKRSPTDITVGISRWLNIFGNNLKLQLISFCNCFSFSPSNHWRRRRRRTPKISSFSLGCSISGFLVGRCNNYHLATMFDDRKLSVFLQLSKYMKDDGLVRILTYQLMVMMMMLEFS